MRKERDERLAKSGGGGIEPYRSPFLSRLVHASGWAIIVCGFLLLYLFVRARSFGDSKNREIEKARDSIEAAHDSESAPLGEVSAQKEIEPDPNQRTIEITMKRGDNLFDLLVKEGIPPTRIHELVDAAYAVHDLSRLRQGQTFTLDFDIRDGQAYRFETDLGGDHCLVIEREGEELKAHKQPFDFEVRKRAVSGSISDSLFLAAEAAGIAPSLTLALAEIYAWDIDFHVDMREGDSFLVLYEEKCLDGIFSRHGRILAALIVNRDRPYWAFRFENSSGRSDYYDENGRSLRKAFLKSPLQYTRISSGFSHRRFHPILKIYRPHLGIDYAAPLGTPVRSIGDGRVTYAGWKGGYGRYVEIRHNDTYTSTYGHLHRIAKGIKTGKYVTQGHVIGNVGSTGLSTGPHLDFRLLKNGKFINPLKVNFPDADPVSKEDMPEFKRQVEELLAELEREDSFMTISELVDGAKAATGDRTSS